MSIITIATSKGGAGKTTLAQVLLGTLTGEGKGVSAIDADYNQSLAKWIKTFAMSSIIVRSVIDEGKMIPTAQELETNHELVVHAPRSDPQQVPCELQLLRRSHLRFLSPTNATRVDDMARYRHLPYDLLDRPGAPVLASNEEFWLRSAVC